MNGNGIRVLVVDDDADAGLLISTLLEQSGYNVLQVYDGLDALAELDKRRFDVIIADFPMPSIKVIELLKYIHAQGRETQVILVSGMLPSTSSVDAGVQPFAWLHTPYKRNVLLGLVRAASCATAQSRSGHASTATMSP